MKRITEQAIKRIKAIQNILLHSSKELLNEMYDVLDGYAATAATEGDWNMEDFCNNFQDMVLGSLKGKKK